MLGELGEHTFKFPSFFYQSHSSAVAFTCPTGALRALTEKAGLSPLVIAPGRGLLVISFFQHEQVEDMRAYDEVVISVPVHRRRAWLPPLIPLLASTPMGSFGHLVLDMPVNSEVNRLRGNVLWNLPKSKAAIQIDNAGSASSLRTQGDQLRLELDIDPAGRSQNLTTTSRVYGALNGQATSFLNVTKGDFLKANVVLPFLPKPKGRFHWDAGPGHPLRKIDPSMLSLFETRVSKNHQSILHLPKQGVHA